MAVSLKLGIKQSQKLTLTQSLRQSIELLQLTNLELAERLTRELEENPVLEEDSVILMPSISPGEGDLISTVNEKLSGDDDSYRDHDEEKRDYYDISDSGHTASRPEDKQRDFIENAVAKNETLKEHLLWQARLSVKDEAEFALYGNIITSIDDNGFLTGDIAELADLNGINAGKLREIMSVIQKFDPIGCGTCSIRESLLVQAEYFHPDDTILMRILKEHFSDLEQIRYDRIARALGIQETEVIHKSKIIQKLDPFPGRQYSGRETRYIMPDVDVKYIDGEIIITLNDDWIPGLTINSYYTNLLRKKSIEKKLREYIQDKVHSARYLVKNIESRRDTILKVVRAIMSHQVNFLIKGPGNLKPLVHAEIARETGRDESTISRVTSGKFVQTGWGVFELRYFFVSRLKSGGNEDRSSDEAMNLIKDIISGENPEAPYSDEEIQVKLQKSGIEIARRTIAKYRGQLNIPPSNRRKKLNNISKKGSL